MRPVWSSFSLAASSRGRLLAVVVSTLVAVPVVTFGAPPVHAASTVFVNAAAAGAHDGTSWADAYTSLADALAAASSGDEIWVAAGTYTPTTGTDRNATFTLVSGVAVYGGFAGTESTRGARDWVAHPTILSGDLLGNDSGPATASNATRSDNSYHVVVGASGATLDGFTITGGNANDTAWTNVAGGILDNAASPTLTNLVISGNSTGHAGGGIYNITGSNPTLTNVTISGNWAGVNGGGIANAGSNPTLTNVTISGNTAAFGGGIDNSSDSSPTLTNVTVSGNSARNGGGIDGGSPVLTNVAITGNSATETNGGGITISGSRATLTNVTISGNSAVYQGGGLFLYGGSPTLTNVTISSNSASTGGGIYNVYGAAPAIRNSILWGNGNGAIVSDSANPVPTPTVSYSIVEGGLPVGTTDGGGNLTADPQFVAPVAASSAPTTSGDDRLRAGSPAINAGDTDTTGTSSPDLAGNPRVALGRIDLGAYEFQSPGVWHVKWDATGTASGATWTDAVPSLAVALSLAKSGDEIWVAAGTYTPTTGTDRTVSFTLKSGVDVYGGFAGTESTRGARDWTAHPTILSGDIGTANDSSDNSYQVVVGADNATLDGFTISGGNATRGAGLDRGGGINNPGTSPTLANLVITGNSAGRFGGGVFNGPSSGPTITNVTISGNSAGVSGGGIYSVASSPTLTNVTVSGNSAGPDGGGIYNSGGSPTLTNVTISGNSASGGAGMYNNSSNPSLTNVLISGNAAGSVPGSDGGGILNVASSPTLTNVTISGNSAASGGGIFNGDGSNPVIRNSIIWGNSGGAIDNYTGAPPISTPTVSDSIVEGGYAGTGNLDADPQFAGPVAASSAPTTTGDYRLTPGSPAINVGSNAVTNPVLPATDLDGLPRVYPPTTGTVDMGAYEYQHVPCAAGTYSASGDDRAGSCTPAAAGHFVATIAATAQTPCAPGTYQPATGQTSCIPASVGYYAAGSGNAAQTQCPVGTTTTGTGSPSAAACSVTLTGRALKLDVLARLDALIATTTRPADLGRLRIARADLARSVATTLWPTNDDVSPRTGGIVFAAEADAVAGLLAVVNDRGSPAPKPVLGTWIDALVGVDRTLAARAIAATAAGPYEPVRLALARASLAAGDGARAISPVVAINAYKRAWTLAISARR